MISLSQSVFNPGQMPTDLGQTFAKKVFMEKKKLFIGKMNLEIKKRIMKCLVWSVALYAAETWTLMHTDRRRLEAFEIWIWRRMEKISWLDKVTSEEVINRVNKVRQIPNETSMDWPCFWDTTDFCMKLLKGDWKANQKEGEEEFKCCTIWQMMMALLHSNGQLKTERCGDTEKGCQKPAVQPKTTDDDCGLIKQNAFPSAN